jgi:hypothetical protein
VAEDGEESGEQQQEACRSGDGRPPKLPGDVAVPLETLAVRGPRVVWFDRQVVDDEANEIDLVSRQVRVSKAPERLGPDTTASPIRIDVREQGDFVVRSIRNKITKLPKLPRRIEII